MRIYPKFRKKQSFLPEPVCQDDCHIDLLIIEDFGMKVLEKQQLLDFYELIEDRHGRKSLIVTSQLPVGN